jgi:hypothetical protein
MADPTIASVAVTEMRGCARRGETGPVSGPATGLGCQGAGGSGAGGGDGYGANAAGGTDGGALAWPGFSGAMPGLATPSTVFCAEAMRGAPPVGAAPPAEASSLGSGGGGTEGGVGGAIPIIVPAN